MTTSRWSLALVLAFAGAGIAQESPATVDLAKGAVEPLDIGGQRSRFSRAAGVDNELNKEEFDADAEKTDGFVRPFDKWEALVRFDKDKNTTVDWLEASAYREDLRARFLAEYDADRNGRLNGEERDKANAALAAGRMPKALPLTAPAQPPAPVPAPGQRPAFGGGPFGGAQNEEFQRIQQQLTQKYDADGDGELNREERRAAREEGQQLFREAFMKQNDTNGDGQIDDAERQAIGERMRAGFQQQIERRFDRDGDGQLSAEERAEMERATAEFRQRAEEGRRQFMAEFDKDGDGELNEEERRVAGETMRQRGEERRREFMQRFDTDGDGELNEEERAKAREEFERNGGPEGGRFFFGGPGGFGGFPGGPGGFGGRRGGQNREFQ